jgi:periplasmic protein TonB
MTEHPFVGLAAAVALSLLAHGFAYASLGLAPPPPLEPPPTRVSFRVRDAAPPPPPAPAPQPPEPPKPEPARAKLKPKSAPSVNPSPAAPPPAAVDLRGVTLTNDTGASAWSSAVGNGSALDGPLGPVGPTTARAAGPAIPTPVAVRAPEIPVVAVADLSSRPVPPELAADLRTHYPPDARQRGMGGSGSVEARIEPDGRVRQVSVLGETFPGFGEACKKTLLGSQWSAPRDKQGHAVATRVRYTCRFVVDH